VPAPVPLPVRQALWNRHQRGAPVSELSQAFGLPPRTVRGLLRRGRERGAAGLAPDPTRPATPPRRHPAYEAALQLRREHPGWGAGLIRVVLAERGSAPPAERTIQRWLRGAGLGPAPPGRRPEPAGGRAAAPHDTWQVDAAEAIDLADGSAACWLRAADEFTGAVLGTAVFPPPAVELRAPGRDPGGAAAAVRAVGDAPPRPGR
jgi:transposase